MSFIDEVRKVKNKDLEKKVIKWLEKSNVKEKILLASKEGYKALNFFEEDIKENEFLFFEDTIEIIEDYLGEGFKVDVRKRRYKNLISNRKYEKKELIIKW